MIRFLIIPLLLVLLISGATAIVPTTINQYLVPQNAARMALRLPTLTGDYHLAGYAQWWADQRKYDCALLHSNGPYGENMFSGSGTCWTPGQVVAGWLSERRWYTYRWNHCGIADCGHYTQIIWRDTRRVGCAKVTCFGGRDTLFVCDYDPPGNFLGERPLLIWNFSSRRLQTISLRSICFSSLPQKCRAWINALLFLFNGNSIRNEILSGHTD
ncbi:Pathogenesis-related protein [Drosera capensis]